MLSVFLIDSNSDTVRLWERFVDSTSDIVRLRESVFDGLNQ